MGLVRKLQNRCLQTICCHVAESEWVSDRSYYDNIWHQAAMAAIYRINSGRKNTLTPCDMRIGLSVWHSVRVSSTVSTWFILIWSYYLPMLTKWSSWNRTYWTSGYGPAWCCVHLSLAASIKSKWAGECFDWTNSGEKQINMYIIYLHTGYVRGGSRDLKGRVHKSWRERVWGYNLQENVLKSRCSRVYLEQLTKHLESTINNSLA